MALPNDLQNDLRGRSIEFTITRKEFGNISVTADFARCPSSAHNPLGSIVRQYFTHAVTICPEPEVDLQRDLQGILRSIVSNGQKITGSNFIKVSVLLITNGGTECPNGKAVVVEIQTDNTCTHTLPFMDTSFLSTGECDGWDAHIFNKL